MEKGIRECGERYLREWGKVLERLGKYIREGVGRY